LSFIVQLPLQLCETQPHHSQRHKHTHAMLVADQLVMAELSVSAAIVCSAPVNGPLNRFGALGYQQCLALA
jgi:hypothetical protein